MLVLIRQQYTVWFFWSKLFTIQWRNDRQQRHCVSGWKQTVKQSTRALVQHIKRRQPFQSCSVSDCVRRNWVVEWLESTGVCMAAFRRPELMLCSQELTACHHVTTASAPQRVVNSRPGTAASFKSIKRFSYKYQPGLRLNDEETNPVTIYTSHELIVRPRMDVWSRGPWTTAVCVR